MLIWELIMYLSLFFNFRSFVPLRMHGRSHRLLIKYTGVSSQDLRWSLNWTGLQVNINFLVLKLWPPYWSLLRNLNINACGNGFLHINSWFIEEIHEENNIAFRFATVLCEWVVFGVVDQQVYIEIAQYCQLLAALQERLCPLELRIALLAAVLDLL